MKRYYASESLKRLGKGDDSGVHDMPLEYFLYKGNCYIRYTDENQMADLQALAISCEELKAMASGDATQVNILESSRVRVVTNFTSYCYSLEVKGKYLVVSCERNQPAWICLSLEVVRGLLGQAKKTERTNLALVKAG